MFIEVDFACSLDGGKIKMSVLRLRCVVDFVLFFFAEGLN